MSDDTATIERDQVALVAVESAHGGAHRLAAQRQLELVVGGRGHVVGGLGFEPRSAPAPPQLVERGVARDPEQPRLVAATPPAVGGAPPVGALERLGRHVLGRRAVAQQRRHVCVDTREGPLVQRGERLRIGSSRYRHPLHERLVHALSTREARIHHEFQSPTLK